MNTTPEAINKLEQAQQLARQAAAILDDLIVPNDFQDVAGLTALAAAELLKATTLLLQSKPDEAIKAIEECDELVDEVYDIIEEDTSET